MSKTIICKECGYSRDGGGPGKERMVLRFGKKVRGMWHKYYWVCDEKKRCEERRKEQTPIA